MPFKFGIERNGVLAELPAPMQMFLLSEGITILTAVALAAELKISDIVSNGPRSSGEIAEETSTNPGSLYRLLRLLSTFGVFSESEPDRFAQTPLSELLRSGTTGSLRPWVRMTALPVWGRVLAEALHSIKTGEPSFKRSMGVELFDYLAARPHEGEIFNEAMSAFGEGVANAVAQAYDFGGVRKIVDVGGGHGILISTILRANPHLKGVLFDLPHVANGARGVLVAARVADRCEICAGDFFESVPAGGDAYVLSWIIHDWDRNRAVIILSNCRRAMNPAGRLLLVETVIPAPDEAHPGKIMDFVMLVGLGGQERTEDQYADLLHEAGFDLRRVVPTASPMSVIEAVPT
ncbi:MAG: methyltransferase [Pyrinomonadaceae bacterium]